MLITTKEQFGQLKDNIFLGELPDLLNSRIIFSGKNNILVCEKGVTLQDSIIDFKENNSLIYLGASASPYIIKIITHFNSVCHIGRNNYINDILTLILSEGQNIFIGNECCISMGIWLRNADPHLIFNVEDKKRINHSKSIYIGDHVWLGQNSMILKGTTIHSGSIIGAMGLVAGKEIASNTCWGGSPASKIKDNVFWSGECVHSWTQAITERYNLCHHDRYIFENAAPVIDIKLLDKKLQNAQLATEKLKILLDIVLKNDNKNRFYG